MYAQIKRLILIISFINIYINIVGENIKKDTINNYIPFFQIKSAGGTVLPTTPIVQGSKNITWFNAASFRFGYSATGRRWQDREYKMPSMGIGMHFTNFYRNKDIGKPIALYMFYAARWKKFNRKLSLNYELNLGYSFDWKPYNSAYNPGNGAIGAKWAVFVAFEPQIIWKISPYFDLIGGFMLSHYSNGGTRKPNNGLNMVSPTLSLRYNLHKIDNESVYSEDIPTFKPKIKQDVSANFAIRQLMVEAYNEGKEEMVPLNYNFEVLGINYNCYYVPNYNYKYGFSLNLVCDASSNAEITINKNTSVVKHDVFSHRISLGIAAYGELCTEYFSIFANIGYNVIHNQSYDSRVYQMLGIKYYFTPSVYGTVGVNANGFSSAKYLFLSVGYTFH